MMVPKWFTPIVVTAVAGISVWLLSEQAPKKPQLVTKDNTIPDTYMEDFTTYIMGKDGEPRHQLSASYMAHYDFDGHSEFTFPEFIFYRPDKSQWIMSAENGATTNDEKEITLQNKVIILRKPYEKDRSVLKIVTDKMLIKPDESYAETEGLITMASGQHKLQSTGFRLYLDDGRVELLSSVKGEYAY